MLRLLCCLLLLAPLSSCGLFKVRPPIYPKLELGDGLVVHDLVVPAEGLQVQQGDRVTIEYTIRLAEDHSLVDSSDERGQSFTFVVQPGETFPGLERGVLGMRERGSRRLFVPAALAYGTEGLPPRIPTLADLRVDVELIELERSLSAAGSAARE